MEWKTLTDQIQLEEIDQASFDHPVVIFKHSTRCSISSTALNRVKSATNGAMGEFTELYYLDLLSYRGISDAIADRYAIEHQSPQVIMVRNGKAAYEATHLSIYPEELRNVAAQQ